MSLHSYPSGNAPLNPVDPRIISSEAMRNRDKLFGSVKENIVNERLKTITPENAPPGGEVPLTSLIPHLLESRSPVEPIPPGNAAWNSFAPVPPAEGEVNLAPSPVEPVLQPDPINESEEIRDEVFGIDLRAYDYELNEEKDIQRIITLENPKFTKTRESVAYIDLGKKGPKGHPVMAIGTGLRENHEIVRRMLRKAGYPPEKVFSRGTNPMKVPNELLKRITVEVYRDFRTKVSKKVGSNWGNLHKAVKSVFIDLAYNSGMGKDGGVSEYDNALDLAKVAKRGDILSQVKVAQEILDAKRMGQVKDRGKKILDQLQAAFPYHTEELNKSFVSGVSKSK